MNCDGRSMTLGWKVPRFSGGAPILGYFVDRREAGHRNWHEVNSAPITERILTVGYVDAFVVAWLVACFGQNHPLWSAFQ